MRLQFFQLFGNLYKTVFVKPVITVQNFEIQTGGIGKTCIYSLAVAPIFLMNTFYNSGILLFIFFAYF